MPAYAAGTILEGPSERWRLQEGSACDKAFGYQYMKGREFNPGPFFIGWQEKMVEMRGVEPLASALRTRRSPN
jgi:hypothetical protein